MSEKRKNAAAGSLRQLSNLVSQAGIHLNQNFAQPAKSCKPEISQPPPRAEAVPEVKEEDLFLQAMGGVKRTSWRRDRHPSSVPPAMPAPVDTDVEDRRLMQAAADAGSPIEILDHPEYIEGWIGVAGKRFLPRLRNGFYSIQGQIDLHGLGKAEAQAAVEEYLAHMSRFHSCCVKIIHGRGINSPTDRATLKESLQQWLSTRKMSRYVVAYASAQFNDGGVGAVYVLLSRQ
jgi:DNA-nicking Smr family endonuclease